MNIDLDVKCIATGKEYKRFLFSSDPDNGIIGAIGEKIQKINLQINMSERDVNKAIRLLNNYKLLNNWE